MRHSFYFGFFILLCASNCIGLPAVHGSADSLASRDVQISKLIQERQQLYGQYQVQLEKKSGIFGNQTKQDLKGANRILLELITTDTRIFRQMDTLVREKERNLGTKKFENVSKEYDLAKQDQRLMEQASTIAKLTRSLEDARKKNQDMQLQVSIYKFFCFLAIVVLLIFPGYRFIKSRFRSGS